MNSTHVNFELHFEKDSTVEWVVCIRIRDVGANLTVIFCVLPQSLQKNYTVKFQIKLLLPSSSCTVPYLLIILPFEDIPSKLIYQCHYRNIHN
jgi:hypothetical protein